MVASPKLSSSSPSVADKCVVSRLSKVDHDKDSIRRKHVLYRLYVATGLCGCFLIVEAVGGYLAGSLAVMSDAAHLFSDLASFAVASTYLLRVSSCSNWKIVGTVRS